MDRCWHRGHPKKSLLVPATFDGTLPRLFWQSCARDARTASCRAERSLRMRRNSLIVWMLCGAACCGGCHGTNGNSALFSSNSTRVPAPGTKSFGSADAGYYPKSTTSGQPAIGTGSDLSPPSSSELTWQPPRSRTAGSRDGVVAAGFNDRSDGSRSKTSSDSPMRVAEDSAPANFSPTSSSSSLRLRGMKASEPKQPAGPSSATDADEPIELSQLPPVTTGSQPKSYRPGSTGLAPAGPEPAPTPTSNLRWRNRS